MIKSMTGYGHAENVQNGIETAAEVRSLNNRYLDVNVRLPKAMAHFEQKIIDTVREYFARGRVNVSISQKTKEDHPAGLILDENISKAYLRLAKDLKEKYSVSGELNVGQLLSFPDIISYEAEPLADETYWQCAEAALRDALVQSNEMREKEGHELGLDFEKRIQGLEQHISEIEEISSNRSSEELDKLRTRVQTLLDNHDVDQDRLELEIAILADRLDVTEECVRFHSHNKLFLDTLNGGDSPGRRLNFLLQEMHREANTIGAKANNAQISHLVVLIKEEVERIREQVQNIE